MATGVIHSGICGYTITVKADSTDGQTVRLDIETQCPNWQKIAAELKEVDAFQELFKKLHMGQVYETFAKYSPHPSCPGLSGTLKTVEVAAGLALPQKADIEVTRE
ncbi:Hypothetical protein DEACI_2323 [Acididesulfobacillus acetoxydans]|uniref:Uncharacterized protein n=1 Tax=Acididesulfobacillus acetoxydans TaxID=1561005 RepID=A0A8S0XBU8_9FIRM|nr:hypothetical protein [Acididesulfobacillus acetoxydans]CAA7601656.1 Hypothetical protein DEACI_2323 [Acididesulfobacillus acetoxydans]CEJ06322.1 Hypothetical protein DEACI_0770 [Acididesulfobacillus acetoxydans]